MGKKRIIQKGEVGTAEGGADAVAKAARVSSSRRVPEGRVYVYSSYNNTLMSLCDAKGNLLAQVSAGAIGFKGTKKSTPFAASKVADALSQIAKNRGVEKVEIFIKGVGSGRDSALRALGSKGFEVSAIRDITPIPHNGPRSRKVRRV
ncbi:MAG TPA: 30S ribosomal protein S11 [Candidatus Wildermuthbacteria bacterium]|uniref:Small ribosomal subunit protein uS11 n=1 Tax=Candidatus Yanofskybacteria bacterium GW2011_GWC1_48_11 TaxID=1619027 RepID=A0A837IQY8_9BACT|nr:MAG: 30S ribosomal protein S11, small subunit ribosomal protein S11 [Candidatus Yanofskybacteria bacterium GW2011_GWC1_48_11]KKW04594.1 MAG: 30S ribosomal protein S11 [Parcubacteria group bacterium GW2011_GWB1_49_12]KKW09148.1 MAG: 30S ribosomal protein S11 [Parcubacteria group bacterium GW2011_GWA1_49_26]KKW13516.1 MAG: 30S ribosomal protein S11 [Parcubacteria group bacterium GW2011_GWA2_50_10]HCM36865.1 30S ribosomal protein S11 [Candidatus Wildermuthbacteria bacterium]